MVTEQKSQVVNKLKDLTEKYSIVASLDLFGLPAKQLQNMREELRCNCEILMTKHRLMTIALNESSKKGIGKLSESFRGMPALIFTNDNPFKLFKKLEKSKSPIAAKAGQVAPKDIIVPAGSTNFSPGPIIGELKSAGIDAGIINGKIEIKHNNDIFKKFGFKLGLFIYKIDILKCFFYTRLCLMYIYD